MAPIEDQAAVPRSHLSQKRRFVSSLGLIGTTNRHSCRAEHRSREYLFDDAAGNVGETEIAAGVLVGQFFVIEAQEMEHGGVKIID